MIFITIFYNLIILLFRKKYTNLVLTVIFITSFIVQYNGQNLLFGKNVVFGRIFEMMPYSVIGFFISYSGIMNYMKKNRLLVIISCLYLLYFFYNHKIFIEIKGFYYQGLQFFFVSICIFISFAMFPSEKIKNKKIIQIIKQITNYTAGIYYLHLQITEYTSKYIIQIKYRTIKGCLIIYLLCYLFCFIGTFIFGKTKLRHLFE